MNQQEIGKLAEVTKLTEDEERIRHRLSNEEVARLSAQVEVSTIGTTIKSPLTVISGKDFESIVEKSGTDVIVDLACSRTYRDQIEREDSIPDFLHEKRGLSKVGIHNYIGIDLAQPEFGWQEVPREHPFENKGMRYRMINQELLQALHSFPDDSVNACMYGVEEENIVRNAHEWALGVLSELKRVVPLNGFICTDFGIIGGTLQGMRNDIQKVINLHREKNDKIHYKFTQEQSALLEGYRVREDDKFFPGMSSNPHYPSYMVDLPSVGFRVYLPFIHPFYSGHFDQPIILINVRKEFEN